MGNPARRHFGQQARRLGRIRAGQAGAGQGGQLALALHGRTERSHAGRDQTHVRPDLAAEGSNRGLAVGARHRHAVARLGAIEAARGQRIGPPHIAGGHQHRRGTGGGIRRGQHGGGAPRQSLRNKGAAILRRPRQGDEQAAGIHLAAVGGHTGDDGVGGHIPLQQIGQTLALHHSEASMSLRVGLGRPSASCQASSARFTPTKGAIRSAIRPTAGAATKPPVRG